MNWLRRFGVWIVAGLAFVGTVLAMASPKKWQKKVVENEEDHMKDFIDDANEEFADSDDHVVDAVKVIEDGKEEIKEVEDSDESMDDLLKRLSD